MSAKPRSVLLIGAYRQALAVARSLARRGDRVVLGLAEGASSPVRRSRAIAAVWRHPPVSEPEAFAAALLRQCEGDGAPDYVFPLGDVELAAVARLAGQLKSSRAVSVTPEVLATCQEKERLMVIAAAHGVATHPWSVADSAAQLLAEAERVGYPLVLKPRLPGTPPPLVGGKARRVPDAAALRGLLAAHPVPPGGVLLQRFATGQRHNVYFVAHAGELRGIAMTCTLRTDREDGSGLSVEGITQAPGPAQVAQTAALVRLLGYTGAGCAQYLVDPATGSSCFLEVNARLGANCAPVIDAGLDVARLFIESLDGDLPQQPPAATGRRYAWFSGDAAGLAERLREGELAWGTAANWLGRLVLAQLRARHHVTWSWRDPLPGLIFAAGSLRALLTGAGRRLLSPSAR